MIAGIASLVFIPLLAITMVHMLWAFGSTFPAQSREALADTVIGRQPMAPRWRSFLVGLAVFVAGIWCLALADLSTDSVLRGGGAFLALVFLARGIIGYLPFWRMAHQAEPFARMDRKIYSPLCLYEAVGFAYLTAWPFL